MKFTPHRNRDWRLTLRRAFVFSSFSQLFLSGLVVSVVVSVPVLYACSRITLPLLNAYLLTASHTYVAVDSFSTRNSVGDYRPGVCHVTAL